MIGRVANPEADPETILPGMFTTLGPAGLFPNDDLLVKQLVLSYSSTRRHLTRRVGPHTSDLPCSASGPCPSSAPWTGATPGAHGNVGRIPAWRARTASTCLASFLGLRSHFGDVPLSVESRR